MTNQKMKFAVSDIQDISESLSGFVDTTQFSLLRVAAFSTAVSAHNTFITEDTLRRTASSLIMKPFVFELTDGFGGDMGTHSEDGGMAGGFVPERNADIEFDYVNGNLMLFVNVLIWKRYSKGILNYFKRDGGKKGISVEIEVFEAVENEKTGLTEILDFVYCAITGLSDLVQPAIENAQAVLVFSKEYEEAKSEYQKTFSTKYDGIDMEIPKSIKNGCKKYVESGGGTSTSIALAKYLIKNENIDPKRVKSLYKMIKSANPNATIDMLGKAGKKWILSLFNQMKELDNDDMSYFSDEPDIEDLQKEDKQDMAKRKLDNAEPKTEDTDVMMAELPKEEDTDVMMAELPKEEEDMAELPKEEGMAELPKEEEMAEEKPEEMEAPKEEEFMLSHMLPQEMAEKLFSKEQMEVYSKGDIKETFAVLASIVEDMQTKFAQIEDEKKKGIVDSFLVELSQVVVFSEDDMTRLKESAKDFSLTTIDGWKNECKAFSFDLPKVKTSDLVEEDGDVTVFSLPFDHTVISPNRNDVWAGSIIKQ